MNTADYFSDAPWKAKDPTGPMPCDCGKFVCERYANEIDPIIIEDRYFSDYCASDLVAFRVEEIIEGVAAKTKKLVEAVDKRNHQIVWEQMFHKIGGNVKHI